MSTYCLVVKRGDFGRYDLLYKTFGQRFPVLWDRRRADRRKDDGAQPDGERRQRSRREPLGLTWEALGFTVARR